MFLSTVGAYAVASTVAATTGLGLSALFGVPRGHMLIWTIMLGFIVYFLAALWCFAEVHAWRVWFVFFLINTLSIALMAALGGDPYFGFGSA
ncbi:MAG: hypothetical protein AAF950_08115 [Pseudomonadota bacterium]